MIQPRDISIEVNKTAPTAEGTLWPHSTTLLPFMSSPESDAPSVCLAAANRCGDSSLWKEANCKTNLWPSANRLRVLRIGKEFSSCKITCASTVKSCHALHWGSGLANGVYNLSITVIIITVKQDFRKTDSKTTIKSSHWLNANHNVPQISVQALFGVSCIILWHVHVFAYQQVKLIKSQPASQHCCSSSCP